MKLVAYAHAFVRIQLLGHVPGSEPHLTHDGALIQAVASGQRLDDIDARNVNKRKDDPGQGELLSADQVHPLAAGGAPATLQPVICTVGMLVNRDGQLGPGPRLALLILHLAAQLNPTAARSIDDPDLTEQDRAEAIQACETTLLDALQQQLALNGDKLPATWVARSCQTWFPTNPAKNPANASRFLAMSSREQLALLALLNRLPSRGHLPPLTWEALMHTRLLAATHVPQALKACEEWLRHGSCFTGADAAGQAAPLPATVQVALHSTTARRAARRILNLVRRGAASRRPIVQLHTCWRPSLARAIEPMLQVDPDWARHRLPIIHLEATRLDEPTYPATLKQFLAPLARAFCVDLGRLDEAFASAAEQVRIIDLLRLALTRHAVLVFAHGLENAHGRQAAAVDFITGAAPLIDAVRCLALPHPAAVEEAGDDTLCTLWVTTSLHPVDAWLPFTSARFDFDAPGWDAQALRSWRSAWLAGTKASLKALTALTCTLDQLTQTQARWLGSGPPPDDLTLILLSTGVWWAQNPTPEVQAIADDRNRLQALMAAYLKHLHRKDRGGYWLMMLASITPEGLSLATLERLVQTLYALLPTDAIPPDDRARLRELLDLLHGGGPAADFPAEALAAYRPCLVVMREQVSNHLGPRVLRWEMGELARHAKEDDSTAPGTYRQCLRFASPVLRDICMDALIEMGKGRKLPRKLLPLAQYAAAIDAFSQASALLAHAGATELVNLAGKRLLVQALSHLSAAGPLSSIDLKGSAARVGASHFPVDPLRRHRMAYAVLYKSLIEDREAWTTSRRFARHELRVAILLSLVEWGRTSRPFAGHDKAPGWQDLDSGAAPAAGIKDCSLGKAAGSEERFVRQLLRNIAHAAVDALDAPLSAAALAALDQAPPSAAPSPSFSARLPMGTLMLQIDVADLRHERNPQRLEFTRLDNAGAREAARRLCTTRVDAARPDLLTRIAAMAMRLEDALRTSPQVVQGYAALIPDMEALAELGQASAESHVDAADWLVRLADVLANETDDTENPPLRQVLHAWLVFWVADKLRAKAGEQRGVAGPTWPRLNSRYFRSGVRLTLKVARRLAELQGADAAGLQSLAHYALEFASDRIGVLSRDYHALARELFHVELLRGALARTYARIKNNAEALDDAKAYLLAAEKRWLVLGGPAELSRRLLMERLSWHEAALKLGVRAERDIHLHALQSDLRLLGGFVWHAGQARAFWLQWARRHRRRVRAELAAQEAQEV